jgi:hypothetical protein
MKLAFSDYVVLQIRSGVVNPNFDGKHLRDLNYLHNTYNQYWWTDRYVAWFQSVKHYYN